MKYVVPAHKFTPKTSNEWGRVPECPVCGRKGCRVSPDGMLAYCFRAGSDGVGETVPLSGGNARPTSIRAKPKKSAKQLLKCNLTDGQLDRGYRAFLSGLELSKAHRDAIAARGLTDDPLAAGYRSFDYKNTWPRINRAVDAARAELGGDVLQLPLVKDPKAVVPGLLIPIRNINNQIVGLRVKPDDPSRGKYIWGKDSQAHCHVAVPSNVTDETLWITEGEFKAEISARRLGARVISLPGVAVSQDEAVATAKALGTQRVVVAFDADLATNKQVAGARDRLVAKLQTAGLKVVSFATWPVEHGKGLDDVLVAGHFPTISPVTQQAELFTGAKGAVKKRQAADRALLLAASELETTPYEVGQKLRRAARCGDWASSKVCAACNGKLGRITIEAENALCPHCSAMYLKSLYTALSTSKKHLPEWTAVGIVTFDDDSPKGVTKNLREIKGWLRRADKGLEQRLRFIRSPGVILFYGDQVEAGLIHKAVGKVMVLDRGDAATRIVAVIERRHKRVLRHFETGDAAGLASEEWAKRFVCTSVGAVAKKTLPWPSLKEMRDLVRESKKDPNAPEPDEDFDPSVSKCCQAGVIHVLTHHGKEVARRLGGRPFSRNESERWAEKIE